LEWDEKNSLNGFVPDYAKVVGQNVEEQECINMLSS